MIEKITELIYLYSSKGKIVDIDFIKQIISTYVNENELEIFLKKVSFTDKTGRFMAEYDIKEKQIYINRESIYNNAINLIESEKIYETEYERILKINLYILKTIIHELGHAKQYQTIYSKDDSFKKELCKLSVNRNLIILNNNYTMATVPKDIAKYLNLSAKNYADTKYYISLPTERMAEIDALNLSKEVIKNLDSKEIEKVLAYESIKCILSSLNAYYNQSPTTYFIYRDNIAKKEAGLDFGSTNLKKIELSLQKKARENNFSLDEKIYYGLPISQKEKEMFKEPIKKYEKILFR